MAGSTSTSTPRRLGENRSEFRPGRPRVRYWSAVSTPREERLAQPPRRERVERPQEYYDQIKERFAAERDLRLAYRPEGTAQFITDLGGPLAQYETDPYGGPVVERDPIDDTVEVLFIGGGFSALLTVGPPPGEGRRVDPHRREGRRRRRHLVLEPVPGRGLRRGVLRLPAAARRDGLRAVPPLRRARRSWPTARPSPTATTSTSWPSSRPP